MIRTDGVVNEESRDLCMHGLHGLQIFVAWASGEQRVASCVREGGDKTGNWAKVLQRFLS